MHCRVDETLHQVLETYTLIAKDPPMIFQVEFPGAITLESSLSPLSVWMLILRKKILEKHHK